MQFSKSFALLIDLRLAIQAGFWPIILAIYHTPSMLLHPLKISRTFMAHVWSAFADGVDENGREAKRSLIPENAFGVVLDLGAGLGHTVDYLNRSRVTKYVALEPNLLLHETLRTRANAAGYTESDGSLLILGFGAEETGLITSALGGPNQVDAIVSILTLCSIPSPQETIRRLVENVLKADGGVLLFYEHVLSDRSDVAWWQRFWAPIWTIAFDGCRIDQPSHLMVERVGPVWKSEKIWTKDGEDEENLFVHRLGKFIKA